MFHSCDHHIQVCMHIDRSNDHKSLVRYTQRKHEQHLWNMGSPEVADQRDMILEHNRFPYIHQNIHIVTIYYILHDCYSYCGRQKHPLGLALPTSVLHSRILSLFAQRTIRSKNQSIVSMVVISSQFHQSDPWIECFTAIFASLSTWRN